MRSKIVSVEASSGCSSTGASGMLWVGLALFSVVWCALRLCGRLWQSFLGAAKYRSGPAEGWHRLLLVAAGAAPCSGRVLPRILPPLHPPIAVCTNRPSCAGWSRWRSCRCTWRLAASAEWCLPPSPSPLAWLPVRTSMVCRLRCGLRADCLQSVCRHVDAPVAQIRPCTQKMRTSRPAALSALPASRQRALLCFTET